MHFITIYFSDNFPQAKQILQQYSPEIFKFFPMHMCHSSVEYKGRWTRMTSAMEQKLCEGRNYEHSFGAVQNSKLEVLFGLHSTWNLVEKQYIADFKKSV